MPKNIKHIAIVGGGTAGWLTAAIIASHHRGVTRDQLLVTLIEASDIPTIGVGEGTWPTMKNTIQAIGIEEKELFRESNAAFKQGGKFVGWVHGKEDFYYHPFTVPLGYNRLDLAPYVGDLQKFASETNFQHHICEARLAPRELSEGEFQGRCNYAYHLDAGAFADYLKRFCKGELGVTHLIGKVVDVRTSPDAGITALQLDTSSSEPQTFEADLFVDCTGFASLLLGEALKVPFVNKSQFLFNDRALATREPSNPDTDSLASHTIATAQSVGWIWDIGLPKRRGVGHVYASQYLSDDEAHANLSGYLNRPSREVNARVINFESGHRAEFWKHNCVAVGLSAGFVEPLEATAIMLVEVSARYIAENIFPETPLLPSIAKRFNRQMDYRWQRIIDFLKLHYHLTQRPEPYWQAHRASDGLPESLASDLALWSVRGPIKSDFEGAAELFPAASYQYVLYGMGFKPGFEKHPWLYRDAKLAGQIIQQNMQLTQQMLEQLPSHRQLINQWLGS